MKSNNARTWLVTIFTIGLGVSMPAAAERRNPQHSEGGNMRTFYFKRLVHATACLLLIGFGVSAHATTLSVNCGGKYGLTTIGAAIKALQSFESERPKTINVLGACHENVVIQSIDRLTLNAVNGASITDASGGNQDVILITDSRGISINNFTINGGDSGIECSSESVCRLNGNTVQGANVGILANVLSQVVVSGGTLSNNGLIGLAILNGSNAQASDATIQNNGSAIDVEYHSSLLTNAVVTNNTVNGGAFLATNGALHCIGCQFTGNGGGPAVLLRRDSSAKFEGGYAITGNTGGGVLITEASTAFFAPGGGTVSGNPGGLLGRDVFCGASFTTGKGATTNIGAGTTNCVEPPQ